MQALLQMQDVPSAINALQLYTNIQPTIRGRNVYVQFSSHQELTTMDQNTQGRGDEPNRILLVTIHHMLYPITVEVLHQVFSPHGFVEKIVTFQKSAGFQALIQYQSRQCAVQARTSLQGRNIYDGCCQLDIQFSNLDELQVNYNNDRSRDFTNPNLPSEQKGRSSQQPAYGDVGMHALKTTGVRGCADLEVTMSCYSLLSLRINSFFSFFPCSWISSSGGYCYGHTVRTIYHPLVIFRMSADHRPLSFIVLYFFVFIAMACLIDFNLS
ncbi:hypothetical protein NC651_005436 [Populus alba x Populus x berolinensis]|nr:hypothetical protein NC651_005436 [Populus alba x Populus x berolinensis]